MGRQYIWLAKPLTCSGLHDNSGVARRLRKLRKSENLATWDFQNIQHSCKIWWKLVSVDPRGSFREVTRTRVFMNCFEKCVALFVLVWIHYLGFMISNVFSPFCQLRMCHAAIACHRLVHPTNTIESAVFCHFCIQYFEECVWCSHITKKTWNERSCFEIKTCGATLYF